MGHNICGILIDSLPDHKDHKKTLKENFYKTKISSLSPKNLSISFKKGCTLILMDMIFYENISEEKELTLLEKDLVDIFPNSKILIFVINDIADFKGYSLLENGKKNRTKAVVGGEVFLDYGEIFSTELEVYEEFINQLRNHPESYKKIETQFSSFDDIEKKKNYLKSRDLTYEKLKIENSFNYTNGSLDEYMIENEFTKTLGAHYNDLSTMDCIEFDTSELDFHKDSLLTFLLRSREELNSKNQ